MVGTLTQKHSPLRPYHAVHNGSCEHMNHLADGSVDLVVTSPPYWVSPDDKLLQPALLKDGNGITPQTYDELLVLLDRCFAEVMRVLKPGGFICVNVASTLVKGKLFPLPFDLSIRLLRSGWELREEIVWRRWRGWDRRGGVAIQNPYPGYFYPNRSHEWVLVFAKPGPPIYKGRTEGEREASRLAMDYLFCAEVNHTLWHILPEPIPKRRGGHPCPFPEELAYRLVTLYSYQGELVLDPFTGTGTTGKVARLTERCFVGYEANPDFARVARARLQETEIRRARQVPRFETLPDATEENSGVSCQTTQDKKRSNLPAKDRHL